MRYEVLFASMLFMITGCDFLNNAKNDQINHNYRLRIDEGQVLKTIKQERGNFLVVYQSRSKKIDTIYISGYIGYDEHMDTITILNKKGNSYRLVIQNLIDRTGKRYNESFLLYY